MKLFKDIYFQTVALILLLLVTLPISAEFFNARNDILFVAAIIWPILVLYFVATRIIKIVQQINGKEIQS